MSQWRILVIPRRKSVSSVGVAQQKEKCSGGHVRSDLYELAKIDGKFR